MYETLLKKYLQNSCTPEEVEQLLDFIEKDASNRLLLQNLQDEFRITPDLQGKSSSNEGRIHFLDNFPLTKDLEKQNPSKEKSKTVHRLRSWSQIAAAVLILVGLGTYIFIMPTNKRTQVTVQNIEPGKVGAVLTLADGSTMMLDSITNGELPLQKGVKAQIVDNKLFYKGRSKELIYNTVSTQRGRQYGIILPDGSKAWLNAASTIRFPLGFNERERKVEITGEVYFEVEKSSIPFIVNADNRVQIEVLGTHFNINSYTNENSLNTTLLEGSIRVIHGTEKSILKPGEQAQVAAQTKVIKNVDLTQVISWKNGFFSFHFVKIEQVMKEIERWYDVEVRYEGKIPSIILDGEMDRGVQLSGVIRFLNDYGIKARLDKRTLILSN